MRKILILSLLLLSSVCFSQEKINTSLGEALMGSIPSCGVVRYKLDTIVQNKFVLRCPATPHYTEPLIVVDRVPRPEGTKFSDIDPNQIESIEILKLPTATAIYGYRASCGVIVITTKRSGYRKFIIKDSLDRSPLAGATVTFISPQNKKERFQYVADDNGIVRTDKLTSSPCYTIIVSAVGYTTAEIVIVLSKNNSGKGVEFFLGRDIKECSEVIITSFDHYHSGCGRAYIVQKVTECQLISAFKKNNDSLISIDNARPVVFNIFPNPAPKGSVIKVQIKTEDEFRFRLRVLSVNGHILLDKNEKAVKGTSFINISTDPRWAAGIYFVQLLYENGRVAASEKVILQ